MKAAVIFFVLATLAVASCRPADERDDLKRRGPTEDEMKEAAAAKYHFASDVQDGISDLTQQREEVRDGLKVRGFYSYSDGHYKRKVNYIADENGYRIESEEVEPLAGPQINPEGIASVRSIAHGNEVVYSVEGDDKTRHEKNLKEKM